jgi:TRAP-type C4-dicarboxylate transport system substrate-binding protein
MVRGEAGSDEQNFYSVRRGRMQMGGVSYGAISTVIPELAVLNAPFLFESYDEIDFVLSVALQAKINEMLDKNGLVGFRHIPASWHIIYSKTPLLRPYAAKNLRMRSRIDASSFLFLKALEADVIHVTGTEVITSLQTGLIDAGETNSFVYTLGGIYTEAPHLTMSRHVPSVTAIIGNKKWWDSLSLSEQEMVNTALAPVDMWRSGMRADETRLLSKYKLEGGNIHYLTQEARQEWVEKSLSSHKELVSRIGGGAQEMYTEIIHATRIFRAENKARQ